MMAENQLQLQIITPDRVFFDGLIEKAVFGSTEGDMGVLPDHIPITTLIDSSMFRIFQGSEEKVIALHNGFVEANGEKLTVLADSAEWPYEIDINRAKEAKTRAEERLGKLKEDNDVNFVRAEIALRKALTRIQVHGFK